VYVVKGDSTTYGTDPELTGEGCCTDNEQAKPAGCCA
jgi:hypothetical protein